MAASPRSLTLSDIKNGDRARTGQVRNLAMLARTGEHARADDARAFPGGSRGHSAPFVWLAGAVLVGVALTAAWPYIKLLATVGVLTLIGGWRHLRIRRGE